MYNGVVARPLDGPLSGSKDEWMLLQGGKMPHSNPAARLNLTEKSQELWDWTVPHLEQECKRRNVRLHKTELIFEKVSVFQVRVRQSSGLNVVDVVFTPARNEWTARSTRGDSATFKVLMSSPIGIPALYEAGMSDDEDEPRYFDCPKGNAVKMIVEMALAG
jgi:hypothetical protein